MEVKRRKGKDSDYEFQHFALAVFKGTTCRRLNNL